MASHNRSAATALVEWLIEALDDYAPTTLVDQDLVTGDVIVLLGTGERYRLTVEPAP